MSSLYNLLAQIRSFLQDGIQYFYKKIILNENMYCTGKNMKNKGSDEDFLIDC